MTIAELLLPEYDQEMAGTRKTLERVPQDKFAYKPDPRSMSMGRLAGHVAEMPGFGVSILQADEIDMATGYQPFEPATSAQLLAEFDKNAAAARAAIEATSDEAFAKTWTLKAGETVYFSMPRVAAIRTMVMNHVIHHRAQLTVYFRLNAIPVPGLYGPSADEQMGAGA